MKQQTSLEKYLAENFPIMSPEKYNIYPDSVIVNYEDYCEDIMGKRQIFINGIEFAKSEYALSHAPIQGVERQKLMYKFLDGCCDYKPDGNIYSAEFKMNPKQVFDWLTDLISSHLKPLLTPEDQENNCPTCGSEVTIGGNGTTHYYIPKKSSHMPTDEQIMAQYEVWRNDGPKSSLNGFFEGAKWLRDNFSLANAIDWKKAGEEFAEYIRLHIEMEGSVPSPSLCFYWFVQRPEFRSLPLIGEQKDLEELIEKKIPIISFDKWESYQSYSPLDEHAKGAAKIRYGYYVKEALRQREIGLELYRYGQKSKTTTVKE